VLLLLPHACQLRRLLCCCSIQAGHVLLLQLQLLKLAAGLHLRWVATLSRGCCSGLTPYAVAALCCLRCPISAHIK
jgi:hypothetical protein